MAYTQFSSAGRVSATSPGSTFDNPKPSNQDHIFLEKNQDAIKDGLRAVQNCVEDEVWELGGLRGSVTLQQWNWQSGTADPGTQALCHKDIENDHLW